MTSILHDISNKITGFIASVIDVISDIDKVTNKLKIPYYVVGATAIDIINILYETEPNRMTKDIDFIIKVPNWDDYYNLVKSLKSEYNYNQSSDRQYRFYNSNNTPVDIIPFGDIESPKFSVITPNENSIMSTIGFEEINDSFLIVTLRKEPLLTVAIPTPTNLVVMKLISWEENPDRAKDAKDIIHIINNYDKYGNFDRLHSKHIDIIDDPDYDYMCGFTRLLGRDIALIAKPATMEMLVNILEWETCDGSVFRLIKDMITGLDYDGVKFKRIFEIIRSLKLGLTESRHQ